MNAKPRILVADDSESVARSMSLVLRRRGYDVSTARDGLEAVQRAVAERFDIIFLDIKMPNLDGVDAFRRIKASLPEAVVVMMTAYTMDEVVQDMLAEGVYRVLRKPVDLATLILLVEKVRAGLTGPAVLLVEDHPESCETLRLLLSRRGCAVHTAKTGEEAIERARGTALDVAFVDMKLPTIDGLDTFLGIHALRPDTPVVLMTGYWDEVVERMRAALDAGAKACLRKPLDLEEVLRIVEQVAAERAPQAPGSSLNPEDGR
jgi:CheY-like chemotaxis protein